MNILLVKNSQLKYSFTVLGTFCLTDLDTVYLLKLKLTTMVTCLIELKPVIQEVNCTIILQLTKESKYSLVSVKQLGA